MTLPTHAGADTTPSPLVTPEPMDPTAPIPVDYIISLLPSAPPSPATSPITSPAPLDSPTLSQFHGIATHTVLPDRTFHRRLSTSSLSPAARAESLHQANLAGERIAKAIKEEEEAQLRYGLDSRTDAGFGRVLRVAEKEREEINGEVKGMSEEAGAGGANERECEASGQVGESRKVWIRSFKYIDERQ